MAEDKLTRQQFAALLLQYLADQDPEGDQIAPADVREVLTKLMLSVFNKLEDGAIRSAALTLAHEAPLNTFEALSNQSVRSLSARFPTKNNIEHGSAGLIVTKDLRKEAGQGIAYQVLFDGAWRKLLLDMGRPVPPPNVAWVDGEPEVNRDDANAQVQLQGPEGTSKTLAVGESSYVFPPATLPYPAVSAGKVVGVYPAAHYLAQTPQYEFLVGPEVDEDGQTRVQYPTVPDGYVVFGQFELTAAGTQEAPEQRYVEGAVLPGGTIQWPTAQGVLDLQSLAAAAPAPYERSGATVTIDQRDAPIHHNTATALTGNLTVAVTAAGVGGVVRIRHNDSSVPTLNGTSLNVIVSGSTYGGLTINRTGTYVVSQKNLIWISAVRATEIDLHLTQPAV
ncbi:hypothetical protein SAMN05421823_102540 [Catalinimonas alkaloidigena]|uniref:Uncharacterized protein n=1 Tax=Catalinimonas alkaloidigena TaxID=1075417 RepID=A0A1G9B7P0_9BACT|nr:hypothetical protein [Catalinimonas alkaloidigena]SDK35562.1 hypothetical protein SAMN05421823_102540 [Catalinimonas alkaloidigena]